METCKYISIQEYKQLIAQVSPRGIPLMCFLIVKYNSDMRPLIAKRIMVFLEYHEYICRVKNKNYSPVLPYSSLRQLTIMAIGYKLCLLQDGCNNTFCNATLKYIKTNITNPPLYDHSANLINYGSC